MAARWNLWLVLAGLNGAVFVALGAYGAHGLGDAPQAQRWFDIALRYHGWHAAALLAIALWPAAGPRNWFRHGAAVLFAVGTILFCGSLYRMALMDLPLFAGAAPIGGTSFILGWLVIAAAGFVRRAA
ncbi:MAG: DUF423 domain-containing protein [Alphaproteobacteria bacterium]|nr:DUF423 domain-containing protein [Alphaproteobacteria bacterium]